MSGTFPPPLPLEIQVAQLHETVKGELPGIDRIAVAIYDGHTDMLQTFVSSNDVEMELSNYQRKLSDVPSLQVLANERRDRVIDDVQDLASSTSEHSKLVVANFGSSYTRPLVDGNRLRGFVFFDATKPAFFTPAVVARLSIYAELISVLLTRSMVPAKILTSALEVAGEISHTRDPETGAHLDRMSHYTLAIARQLAESHGLSDVMLQHLLALSPLHDLGKVAIPDSILLKPAKLSSEEIKIMQTHTLRGAAMINRLVERLALGSLPQISILHNIVLCHHECWDGSGYPGGLCGEAIPIEARIVAVADVYDALTSVRPYKKAWTPERAGDYLTANSGTCFDPDVVGAFHAAFDEIEVIRSHFKDGDKTLLFNEGHEIRS